MLPSPLRHLPTLFGVIDVELRPSQRSLHDEHGVIFMAEDDVSRLLGVGKESEVLALRDAADDHAPPAIRDRLMP